MAALLRLRWLLLAVALAVAVAAGIAIGLSSSATPRDLAQPPPRIGPADNGRTFQVHRGDEVRTGLSVYWRLRVSGPLAASGAPTLDRSACGGKPAGSGCAVVIRHFVAQQPGTAVLSATRQTCGEALACAPSQRAWRVTVEIVAP